jgi:hypothetical protein
MDMLLQEVDPGTWGKADAATMSRRKVIKVRRGAGGAATPTPTADQQPAAADTASNPFAGVSLAAPAASSNPFAGVSLAAAAAAGQVRSLASAASAGGLGMPVVLCLRWIHTLQRLLEPLVRSFVAACDLLQLGLRAQRYVRCHHYINELQVGVYMRCHRQEVMGYDDYSLFGCCRLKHQPLTPAKLQERPPLPLQLTQTVSRTRSWTRRTR